MRVTIAGAGYVGLVAAACYATTGNHVTLADIDQAKIDALNAGVIPIFEPGLTTLIEDALAAGRIVFTTDLAQACVGAEIIGIAVGTPPAADGTADLQYVRNVAETIGKSITDYTVVVTKSTVAVGTHKMVTETIRKHTDVEFDYASNPEFLKEGSAVSDFMKPERVIIGTNSPRAEKVLQRLYGPFMRQGSPILCMDPASAELTKYACNAMLAVRISFMNEVARLADHVGADVRKVRAGMGSDSRIGPAFLYPGLGYGGSGFAKDVQAFVRTGNEYGLDMEIVSAAHRANHVQPDYLLSKIYRYFSDNLKGKRIALWGLSFKPQTDDMREAPSLTVIKNLLERGASVQAYDPEAIHSAKAILGDSISYCDGPYDAIEGADALVICTEWMEFRSPDFTKILSSLSTPVIFDGRNLYDVDHMKDLGLDYYCIGRPDAGSSVISKA